ncbi:MAG: electron transfer flavoprotein subunit alpha [candidate division Zixibacteria bacterium]|nr:electron transfer flavoprotein subunit alpha [candidate division Zixibacteria bacterium]
MSNTGYLLVFCEDDGSRAPALISLEVLGLGRKLAGKMGLELAAVATAGIAEEIKVCADAKVFTAPAPPGDGYRPEWYVALLEETCRRIFPDAILFGHTPLGQDLAPRLAQRLDAGVVTDVVGLSVEEGSLLATKPVQGGIGIATYGFNRSPRIVTVRPRVGTVPDRKESNLGEVIEIEVAKSAGQRPWELIERIREESDEIKLEDADIVVAGGRGIGGSEGFETIRELAQLLGAAVGSSRPPCDLGWITSSRQIGITGTIIGPQLYIALGISGASQHLSGIGDSKTIIAINKDREADIFRIANYGIIGDYRQVLPTLIDTLRTLRGPGDKR